MSPIWLAVGWLGAGLGTVALVWRSMRASGTIDWTLGLATVLTWPIVLTLASVGVRSRVAVWIRTTRTPHLAFSAPFQGVHTVWVPKGHFIVLTGVANDDDADRFSDFVARRAPRAAGSVIMPTGATMESVSEKEMAARGWKRVTSEEVRRERASALSDLVEIAAKTQDP